MKLVKVSLLNGLAVIARVGSSVALNKILAIYLGPSGYAIIGQFQNIISVLTSLSAGVITSGVIKKTAEHYDKGVRQHDLWRTAIKICLISSILISIFLLLSANWITVKLLHSEEYYFVFIIFAFILPLISINNIVLAVINGKKEIGILAASSIITSILNLIFIGMLSYLYSMTGTFIGIIISPAIGIFFTVYLLRNKKWFNYKYFIGRLDINAVKDLSLFGLMGIITALCAPTSYIIIRDYLIKEVGLQAAGYWQAIWKISELYLLLITSTLSAYYLPRLAEIRKSNELKDEIFKVLKFVMPITIFSSVLIYLTRDYIIKILFTDEFMPMRNLFIWQLIGDVIKIAAWVLSYVMLGRAMVKSYVYTEIIFSAIFVILTIILVEKYGLAGVTIAYMLNYFLYLIVMFYIIKNELQKMKVDV